MSDTQHEQRGVRHLNDARKALQESTQESAATSTDDLAKEHAVTGSSGSKSGNKKSVPVKQHEQASQKGTHSGRPIPVAMKLHGDENGGASNGGEHNAQNTNKYVSE
jgi:hypothetical protein